MLAPSGSLLRAGIGLKLSQIKIATRSYLRDRTNQATGTMTSYAIAAGLFAAAGIFLIAACLVGTVALYRWIAIHYGQFWGFGAIGALLVTIAAICAGLAAARLRQPPPHFPTLTSRLRVAIKANPLEPGQIDATSRQRLFTAVILLALIPFALSVSALAAVYAVAVVHVALIAYESTRFRDARHRIRHPARPDARPQAWAARLSLTQPTKRVGEPRNVRATLDSNAVMSRIGNGSPASCGFTGAFATMKSAQGSVASVNR